MGRGPGQLHLSIGSAPQCVPTRPPGAPPPPRPSISAPGEPCILPSGEDLRVRKRRGTGGTESSKINGLAETKLSEDFLGSSSGYSSEDDYIGR